MSNEVIEVSRVFPAAPRTLWEAWLDGPRHSAMTGSPATVESRQVGGRFSAWDGYIDGSHLVLEEGRRIVQSWRSDDFPLDAEDSRLEVRFEPVPGGTRVTIRHTELPEGQGPGLLEGWSEHYLAPMTRYFGEARAVAKRAPRAKAGAAPKKRIAKRAVKRPVKRPVKRAVKRGATRPKRRR